jgi:hypothetical protein
MVRTGQLLPLEMRASPLSANTAWRALPWLFGVRLTEGLPADAKLPGQVHLTTATGQKARMAEGATIYCGGGCSGRSVALRSGVRIGTT